MAKIQATIIVTLAALMLQYSTSYDFYVGGREGWGINPSTNYSTWAQQNRFRVNDKLVFKYNKDNDSVLLVTKEDYESCNASKPITKMDTGTSVFVFDHPGHFYFISGRQGRCMKGEKMIVAVMSHRRAERVPPSLAPSPSPVALAVPLVPSSSSPLPSGYVGGGAPSYGPGPAPIEGGEASSAGRVGSVCIGVFTLVFGFSFFLF